MGSTGHRGFCAILAVLLAFPFLFAGAGQAQGQKEKRQNVPAVVVSPAKIVDLRERSTFTGRLTAIQKVDIRARVTGFLEAVTFTEGNKVKKGDVLYRIEDEAYRAAVEEIKGSISAAEADLRLAQIQRERKATLVKRETVAQSELDIALATLGKTEGELERLKGVLAQSELKLSYTVIEAPFDGVTGLSKLDVGAFVDPEAGALTTLIRLDPMQVEFPVSTAQLLQYRARHPEGQESPGANVRLLLADGTRYPLEGKIDFVDAEVAPGTDTVTIRAQFQNPDGILLDGALVSVELELAEPQLVLSVPRRAVQRDQQGSFVLVVDEASRVELRRVEIVRTSAGRSVVEKGLTEGELVITEGVNKVRPGIIVDAAQSAGG